MRRDDHLVELQQLVIGGRRLLAENIERRAGNRAARDRFVKRIFVDQTAARAVDDPRALFHLADRFAIDEATRFGSQAEYGP